MLLHLPTFDSKILFNGNVYSQKMPISPLFFWARTWGLALGLVIGVAVVWGIREGGPGGVGKV